MKMDVQLVQVEKRILSIRGQNVMIDHDLAELYEVPTRVLIQAIKRNSDRFPSDFMFQLNESESQGMRSQSVIASKRNVRFRPYAFTEQGVAMLSSVLRSKRAVHMNIAIMRAFVKLRELLITNAGLADKLRRMDQSIRKQGRLLKSHGEDIQSVFTVIAALLEKRERRRKRIGFKA
jgi:hypothetical protein